MAEQYLEIITKNHNFRHLWLGLTISYLGDALYDIAIAWYVYSLTESSLHIALILVAMFLPKVVFGLVLGVMVDRYSRKRLMLLAQAVQAISAGVLAVALVAGFFQLWMVYVVTVLLSIAASVFGPAQSACLTEIVEREQLLTANSFFASSRQVAQLIGTIAGGTLIAWIGAAASVGANALSFLLALLLVQRVHFHDPVQSHSDDKHIRPGIRSEIGEGLRWLGGQRTLLYVLVIATVANIALGPVNVLPPMLVQQTLHEGGHALGWFQAAAGLGILVGSLALGKRRPSRIGLLFGLSMGGQAVGMALVSVAPQLWLAAVGNFLLGVSLAGVMLPVGTAFQVLVPSHFRGRVGSINTIITGVSIPLTYGVVGALGDIVGPRLCYAAGACMLILCMIVALLVHRVRSFDLSKGGK